MTQLRQKMLEELQRRNYSHRTAKTYVRIVRDFADVFSPATGQARARANSAVSGSSVPSKKLAPATVSQYVSALRFLFVKTLRRHFLAEYIPFPKSRKRLPTVLSPEEVTRLIDAACNLYHRTLLMTLYSTAARRAELCRLKVQDIDSQRMMIRIHQGKGGRDRDVPLSPKLLETLRVYWRWMQPTTFLFPGYRQRSARRRPHQCQHRLVGLPASCPKGRHHANAFLLTACGIVVLPTCSKPAPTCVPFRSYSDIPDWNTPSSTCISPPSICRPFPIRSMHCKSPAWMTCNAPGG